MKQAYKITNFKTAALKTIETANDIIQSYQDQGYELTLRQLYYQFVARDLLPNCDKSYDNLGELISQARLSGLVDWDAIKDRTRYIRRKAHWDNPGDIVEAAASQYRRDLWEGQPVRVEVWVEKDALIDIVQQAADLLDVPAFSCRGYVSQTAMYEAARRMRNQTVVLLHLGDHDPSGIDMTRDIQERLSMFGADVDVVRIALNMNQVEEYSPPPNPAKLSDSRCADYISQYGDSSWELDALEPSVLTNLIQTNIHNHRDADIMDKVCARQDREKAALKKAAAKLVKEYNATN